MTDTRPEFDPPRKFIRHVMDVPLEVELLPTRRRTTRSVDVGLGGLSFIADEAIASGTEVVIRIPVVHPPFEARARVAWARPDGDQYCIGVEFLDAEDSFRARMVEQVCAIDQYRRQLAEEGRTLTAEQAADEWIRRYAGRFPQQ
jgi:hypothetical protein